MKGISPGPGGNFLEGRKSYTIGVEANYLNKLVFDLSWTRFYGADKPFQRCAVEFSGVRTVCDGTDPIVNQGGVLNQIHDRDFASFSVKYSF